MFYYAHSNSIAVLSRDHFHTLINKTHTAVYFEEFKAPDTEIKMLLTILLTQGSYCRPDHLNQAIRALSPRSAMVVFQKK